MAEENENTEQLRAQAALLLSRARAQAFDIQRALSATNLDGRLQSRLTDTAAQIANVATDLSCALNSTVFPLCPGDLMALAGEVQSSDASTLVAEATAQAASMAARQKVIAAAVATRSEVQSLSHDIYDRRVFDPYLHFSSPEDEAEFRKRQAEAQSYIDTQIARHTSEGDLNAGGGAIGAMLDLNVHGAGASPDFLSRWNALVQTTEQQRIAMHAAGQSTAEFDCHVTDSVRRFLKAKGLSDAEIDRRLTASANPLDAVKPFLESDRDSQTLEHTIRSADHAAQTDDSQGLLPRVEATAGAPTRNASAGIDFDALTTTKLKGVGLQAADDTEAGHGLTIQKPAGKGGPSVAG